MERSKTLLFATLALSGTLLLGCGSDEPEQEADSAQTATTAEQPHEGENDVAPAPTSEETDEQMDITTGSAGTTSGITGSDMDEEDETTGGGQTQGDDMMQSDPAGADTEPEYETSTPEQEDEASNSPPGGGDDNGESQASTDHQPDESEDN